MLKFKLEGDTWGKDYSILISAMSHRIWLIVSVKSFKSENHDKIYPDAKNPNLKNGCDGDFRATA